MKLLLLVLVMVVLGGGAAFAMNGGIQPGPSTNVTVNTAAAPPATPQPAVTPAAGEATVELTEAELTQQLNANVAGKPLGDTPLGPATARDFAVKLQSGQMTTTGTAQVAGTSVPVTLIGVVGAQSGKPTVTVQEAKVGGVPLPDSARRQVEQSIQGQLEAAVARQRLQVRSVRVDEGRLTIVGSRES